MYAEPVSWTLVMRSALLETVRTDLLPASRQISPICGDALLGLHPFSEAAGRASTAQPTQLLWSLVLIMAHAFRVPCRFYACVSSCWAR